MDRAYLPEDEEGIRQLIGAGIIVLCRSREQTVEGLADFLGKSQREVEDYIKGEGDISAVTLFKVGQFLSSTMDRFFDPYYNTGIHSQNDQYFTEVSNHQPSLLEIAGLTVIRDTNDDIFEPVDSTNTAIQSRKRDV